MHAVAMASWHDANAARRRMSGEYDKPRAEASAQRLMEVFDAGFFARPQAAVGSHEGRTLFLVGMPRSGPTLTEQILDIGSASCRDSGCHTVSISVVTGAL